MKTIVIIGVILLLLVALVTYFGLGLSGERAKSEETWYSSTSQGSINGTWGTSIEVEYQDGSTEILNTARPLLEISFGDKKVSNFKYILSSKGTSDQFNAIDVDMSDFQVLIKVSGESKEWGRNETAGTAITVDMDGLWHEIYRIQVDSSELSALDIGFYNMSFIPFGSMEWRGSLSDDWTFIKLPSTFYLNFDVVIEDTDDDGFLDDEEKQIEVELISGTSET